VVPFSSRIMLWLAGVTPQPLYDFIMRWATGLSRRQLPPAKKQPQLGAHAG
jgi:hypothetical protein